MQCEARPCGRERGGNPRLIIARKTSSKGAGGALHQAAGPLHKPTGRVGATRADDRDIVRQSA